jgi:type II secretory ATPase GspE/PulE/Tfp pilus assembly ATPase PilB-like protein
MTTFDPNKLDIDFDNLDQQAAADTPKEIQVSDPLDQVSKVTKSSVPKIEEKQEPAQSAETQVEKTPSTQATPVETAQSREVEAVYDINLSSIDDIMGLLIENRYSFVTLEPSPQNYVEVIFRDEGTPVMTKRISYPVYTQILLKMKAMSKLVVENTTDIQNGAGELKYKNTWYKIVTKTSPDPLGEKIFFKASPVAKKIAAQRQQAASFKTMLKFMGVVAFLFLVL